MIEGTWHGPDVGVVTIHRHEQRNALNLEHCESLIQVFSALVERGARAVVVTGEGSSFCSGADLDGVYDPAFRDSLYAMLQLVTELPVPVFAAVNGPAIGAGTQLAIACDYRVGAESAVFGVPTAALGIAVDQWTIDRLAELAGGGVARGMVLALDRLDVARAYESGLVNRYGTLEDTLALAERVAAQAPLTLAYSKLAFNVADRHLEVTPEVREAFDACWASDDAKEGARARQEKRAPRFSGS